MIWIKVIRYMH